MKPYLQLEATYAKHPREFPLAYYVDYFLTHPKCFVFSTPEFVVLGREVARRAPEEMILDHRESFAGIETDCWHLFACAGDMGKMWRILPRELPWFCWSRIFDPLSELRFVRSEILKRHCPPDLR